MKHKVMIVATLVLVLSSCEKGNPVNGQESQRSKIVFVMHDTTAQRSFIYKMVIDGGNVTQLMFASEILDTVRETPRGRGAGSEPRWSPDGKRIVYSESLGPDESHIVMMNEDGSNKKILTPVGGYCIRPKWSPQGDRILYLRGAYMGAIIATSIVDTNGNSFDIHLAPESRVFEGDSVFYNLGDSQWYQDGQHLYVWGSVGERQTVPLCGGNPKGEIFLLRIATGSVVSRLTRNTIDECGFEITTDGIEFLLVRYYGENDTLLIYTFGKGVAETIPIGHIIPFPHWSNDAKSIVIAKDVNPNPYSEDPRIWVIERNNSYKLRQVFPLRASDPEIFVDFR